MEKYIPTPEEFTQRLADIITGYDNTEITHIRMDGYLLEVLCSLGYEEGCFLFKHTEKWYS